MNARESGSPCVGVAACADAEIEDAGQLIDALGVLSAIHIEHILGAQAQVLAAPPLLDDVSLCAEVVGAEPG